MRRRSKKFGLEVVMVNVWEHRDARKEALHFCQVHKIEGPVLLDVTGEYISRLGLRGVPNNIVVNRKGVVVSVGTTTPDEIRATLTKLLLPFG